MRMSGPPALALARAVRTLRAGGVIAYPTEGVWGLGCDPWQSAAVQRLLALKGRAVAKGLILVAGELAQVEPWLRPLTAEQRAAVGASWPGPVTWVLPAPARLPQWISGRHRSVAVRVSAHTGVRALSLAFGAPIVSTSANPQGRPPARSELAVRRYFRDRLDYVLPGRLGGQRGPSTIRDARTGRVLRPG